MDVREAMTHRMRQRSRHPGEYVAWIGDEIVAHGKKLDEVIQEAKKHGDRPVIEKVLSEGVHI